MLVLKLKPPLCIQPTKAPHDGSGYARNSASRPVNIAAGVAGLLVTVLLAIPRHNRLEEGGKNETTIAELVRYNWPRTLSISSQALITFLMLRHVFGAM